MNELPVIVGCMPYTQAIRKGFWDRQGANIASCCEKMYGGKLFDVQKTILQRDTVLSEIDLGNVDTWQGLFTCNSWGISDMNSQYLLSKSIETETAVFYRRGALKQLPRGRRRLKWFA